MTQRNVDIALETSNTNTPKITIPKETKFLSLNLALTPDFEWIKTRSRIIEEGKKMRHCVASYAHYINKDECAIYHLTYDNKACTVEFGVRNDAYIVK